MRYGVLAKVFKEKNILLKLWRF